ncbi:hypothetical protein [Alkalibacterium kapii]|uniref:Lipoprotein n=1 Tax=Alkalibacterium kapii TaxID=426704 RepID=A0A511AR61_9LACT|nr:hypothetical protein [Alkalibacterium kapii]GEK90694.1 hypothetical protein AKA01nite_03160 [Alkalibacterium kapii]
MTNVKSTLLSIAAMISLIGLSGCSADDQQAELETRPFSLLRIKDGKEDTQAPRNMLVKPEKEKISVFYTFEENYENHELEEFEVTGDTIDIIYDDRGLSLTDIDNRQYEDKEGNIYELKWMSEIEQN